MELRPGYKQTEVGVIPDDWEVKQLMDVMDIDPDNLGTNTRPNFVFNYISLEDVDAGALNNYSEQIFRTAPSRARRKLNKGDVLVATVRPNLKSHLLFSIDAQDWVCSTGFSVIRCKAQVINSGYVFFHLFGDCVSRQIESMLTGSNYPAINSSDVRSLKIPIPKYDEQCAIASVLSDVDALIASLDKLVAKKRNIKQGAMQQLLTGKKRLPGFSGEWDIKKLDEIVDFKNGKAHENCISEFGIYKVVNSKFISTEGVIFKYSEQNLSPLNKGDIALVMSDIPNGKALAKCFLIDKDGRYTLNQRICSLMPKKANGKFLFYLLNRNKYFLDFDSGTGQTNLRPDEILICPLHLPPTIEEQAAISTVISDMDAEIAALEARRDKTQAIKQGMMQALLTGRIRLKSSIVR